ncbi:hypothetical protein E3N88_26721 [Mikania micrantha]|uniref:Uncharacterized protein n=1 Tax=Mikania micrantha TaxID=192012 RepID=A0A5N6MVQ1_9ASTR|nr:hypothetical protein E3N88_26721 [Mikania micrantha]
MVFYRLLRLYDRFQPSCVAGRCCLFVDDLRSLKRSSKMTVLLVLFKALIPIQVEVSNYRRIVFHLMMIGLRGACGIAETCLKPEASVVARHSVARSKWLKAWAA